MERLDPKKGGLTPDIIERNIELLRELFPDAFTESSDENRQQILLFYHLRKTLRRTGITHMYLTSRWYGEKGLVKQPPD
jgi:hypothetical protein